MTNPKKYELSDLSPTLEERLHAASKPLPNGCIEYTGTKYSSGYGVIYGGPAVAGRVLRAHRVAYFFHHGEWPSICRHTCDNPSCVNPEHLVDGSQADNIKDMWGRGRAAAFSTMPSADEIAEMYRLRCEGSNPYVIADRTGFGVATVYKYLREAEKSEKEKWPILRGRGRPKGTTLTAEQVQRAEQLYFRRWKVAKIARELGVSYHPVYRLLRGDV